MKSLQLDSGHIRVAERGPLLHVTLARPDKLNALTQAMYLDLSRAVAWLAERDDLHALLLDGEGRSFCAGNDIGDFVNAVAGETGSNGVDIAMDFIHRLLMLDKPVVAAVQGNATGIGTTMLLHSDLVIAADSARFCTAFIHLGLTPEAGSSLLLPQLIGRQNAARLLLAGDSINADEAERMGLVAYRCRDEQLAEKSLAVARALTGKAPQAMQSTKRLMRECAAATRARIDKELQCFSERMFSDEARAAFAKFIARTD